ncbi:ATP-binding protein [Streptomyces armeniacus]|uniref:ATP-binding protein n=1 Tax=Streptomyces armeniacus TaxID=83291 RepID=UPI001FE34619|nr:ATP-binding protein [Streptomyces armeniacus]
MSAYARTGRSAATTPGAAEHPRYTRALPRTGQSAEAARDLVRTALSAWGLDGLADAAAVLVSELVGNAVEHTASRRVRVTVTRTGRDTVRIAVSDTSRALPVRREPDDTADRGRGLIVVEALADQWGIDVQPSGKRVWGELTREDV